MPFEKQTHMICAQSCYHCALWRFNLAMENHPYNQPIQFDDHPTFSSNKSKIFKVGSSTAKTCHLSSRPVNYYKHARSFGSRKCRIPLNKSDSNPRRKYNSQIRLNVMIYFSILGCYRGRKTWNVKRKTQSLNGLELFWGPCSRRGPGTSWQLCGITWQMGIERQLFGPQLHPHVILRSSGDCDDRVIGWSLDHRPNDKQFFRARKD